jgi:selenocysteine lyase/cysteine desulfurase
MHYPVGLAMIRKDLFEELEPFKIMPAPNSTPEKFEIGTQNHEGIAGVSEAIAFIADMGHGVVEDGSFIRSGISVYRKITVRVASGLKRISKGYI